jgi:hypothetical protein
MPVLSGYVASLPQSELAWQCDRCKHVFDKGLDMCPQCTSQRVTEVRMAKIRKGQVEAEEAARLEAQAGEKTEDSPKTSDDGTDNAGEGSGDNPYDGWVKKDLQRELEKRDLSKTGNITDLTDRLLEDDRAKAEAQAEAGE